MNCLDFLKRASSGGAGIYSATVYRRKLTLSLKTDTNCIGLYVSTRLDLTLP